MLRKISLIILPLFLSLFFAVQPSLYASQAVEYLCELGVVFYRQARYEDALKEFKEVLLIDANHPIAKKYVTLIFEKSLPEKPAVSVRAQIIKDISQDYRQPYTPAKQETKPSREEAMDEALNNLSAQTAGEEVAGPVKKKAINLAGINITGDAQVSVGMTPEDAIWKRANFDLNEREWRLNSNAAYDRMTNTYDPRVYDRLRVNLDTPNKEGFGFHTNITVDPWSFTGKSPKQTLTSRDGADYLELELKYWSNTGYTINEIVPTLRGGESVSLPEIKIQDERTPATMSFDSDSGMETFDLTETKIIRQFQPLRELWLDYKQDDNLQLRFFPMAYQDQAFTSDDPLKISNNHIWWEDSPWLRQWTPGIYNSGDIPVDFTKGYWDNALSFFTRDSDGQRLTSLRGFSFNFKPQDLLSVDYTFASPKNLWQDYSRADNIISALRLKSRPIDNLSLGATYTMRMGFDLAKDNATDSRNNTGAVDASYEIMDGLMASLEAAYSASAYDLTNRDYRTEPTGNAYYFSIIGRYPFKNIMDLKYGYDDIRLDKGGEDKFLLKGRFFASYMDSGFDPSLATYHNTRDDAFWSRHIHFRTPMQFHNSGLNSGLKMDDIMPYAIGNGIDIGRNVVGLRLEAQYLDKFSNLFDLRNVHNVNGKQIETVARDEIEYKVTPRLTAKGLGLLNKLPKTQGGIDPYRVNDNTGLYYLNTAVEDGMNASLKTGSLGLEYEFFDWMSLNGIYERTNDYTLAYDDFPRKVLTGHQVSYNYWQDDKLYRDTNFYFNYPGFFPTPPYPFYNIFKTGLRLNPIDKLEIYLDYTRNEFESAGQIDDNINHVGMEVSYLPFQKLGLYFRYTYSRWNDLNLRIEGSNKYYLGHHNVFGELRYFPTPDDELSMQYGETSVPIGIGSFDPYGGSLATLDTQHIFRLYYRRKF